MDATIYRGKFGDLADNITTINIRRNTIIIIIIITTITTISTISVITTIVQRPGDRLGRRI